MTSSFPVPDWLAMVWPFVPAGLPLGGKPVRGLGFRGAAVSGVRASSSVQPRLGVKTHWPVAGLHTSVVQMLLSLQTTSGVKTQSPVAGLHTSLVQPLLSSQTVGTCEHAPGPDAAGSQ